MVYSPYTLIAAGMFGLAFALVAYFANQNEKQKVYRQRPSREHQGGENIKKSKKDSPNCTDYSMCIVCNENRISSKYIPCGHSFLCDECNIRLRRHSKQCIQCYKHIDRYVSI